MTISLTDLGEDIIASNIAVHLIPEDIYSLSLTSRQLYIYLTTNDVYHLLYSKKFGTIKPTPLNLKDYNWKELFFLRTSPRVKFFTWGSSSLGRLGYLFSDIPQENISRRGLIKNVHTPTNVKNFNNFIVTDISSGGFSFQILTNDGSLFHTGLTWSKNGENSSLTPGPLHERDYSPPRTYASSNVPITPMPFIERMASRRMIRRPVRSTQPPSSDHRTLPAENTTESSATQLPTITPAAERSTNPNLRLPPEQQSYPEELFASKSRQTVEESNFITKLTLPKAVPHDTRILAVSSGREHFIALDNFSNIYTWDTGNSGKSGVQLEFPGLKSQSVTKISAGWNLSACHVKNVGIVVWYARDIVSKENYEDGSMKAKAHYVVVPQTKKVDDFVALTDLILFVKQGTLYKFSIWAQGFADGSIETAEDPLSVTLFNDWLYHHNDKNGSQAVFSKVSGCYNNFTVFTNDGHVLLGNKSSLRENEEEEEEAKKGPLMIDELQKKNIIHVVMGDYHCLALTDDGEVLSWGMESNACGCLGLGSKEDIEKYAAIEEIGRNLRVSSPSIVKKPTSKGKWLGITAAGWHSGGIYLPMD